MKLILKICIWSLAVFFFGQIVLGALCGILFFLWAMLEQFALSVGWVPAIVTLVIILPPAIRYIVLGRIFPQTSKG